MGKKDVGKKKKKKKEMCSKRENHTLQEELKEELQPIKNWKSIERKRKKEKVEIESIEWEMGGRAKDFFQKKKGKEEEKVVNNSPFRHHGEILPPQQWPRLIPK